jgi:uncharacterized protein YggU (UPF0235/DUF167 family)
VRLAVRLAVRLTPKGGRDKVEGWARDEAGRPYLKVRVSAAPVDGAANAALVALIAKTLRRPRSAVTLAAGAGARLKMLDIEGLDEAALAAAFGAP